MINQYQNLESSELLQQDNASAITIEEIDDSDEEQERSNLASQLRPQFSNKPEIIEPTVASEENTEKSNPDHDNSKIESEDTLLAPGASSNVSSKSSLFKRFTKETNQICIKECIFIHCTNSTTTTAAATSS